jgi:CDP-diacylglycerol--glycerol-3-phosphate 3-phosphatidyltransferase
LFRHVPNLLTGARLLLAFVFFAMLSYYQYEGRGDPSFLNVAFVIYLVALITDFLDGYLARKWKVEGAFGRVVDPFVDKVLVLGSFIFFAGKNFIIPETASPNESHTMVVRTLTGIAPGIVVILLARELLVTSLRAASESSGHNFGAAFSGKLKMVIQSATILVILIYVNYFASLSHSGWELTMRLIRDVFIWATVVITVLSGVLYVQRAVILYRADEKRPQA